MLERILEAEIMDSEDEAHDYDGMDHLSVNQDFVRDLLTFSDPGREMLDLGTGTARIPIEICRRVDSVRIIAVDLAPSMLDVARINIEIAGMPDRIMLDRVDAKSLDSEDNRFDSTISNSMLHHISKPETVVIEAKRVTRPGGVIFFRDLMRPESTEQVEEFVDKYAGSENDHAREMFYNSLRAALSVEEMRDLVKECGFDAFTVQATSDRHWTWSTLKPMASPS